MLSAQSIKCSDSSAVLLAIKLIAVVLVNRELYARLVWKGHKSQSCSCICRTNEITHFFRCKPLGTDKNQLQGELEVTTEAGTGKAKEPNPAGQVTDVVDRVPFLFLGLDLPPAPLYKDVMETNIIPQVSMSCIVICLRQDAICWRQNRIQPNAAGQVVDVVDRVPFLFLGLDLLSALLFQDVMETNIILQVSMSLGRRARMSCRSYLKGALIDRIDSMCSGTVF